jgi:hypothetical protein
MPRTSPLTRSAVEINIRPLSAMALRRIADALGLGGLPDYLAILIACLIASHRTNCKLAKGHRPAKVAAGLLRIESLVCHGHDGPETMRKITDPHFGMDVETWTRLAPIVADPDAPRDHKLAEIKTRRLEVEAVPPINPHHAQRVTLVAHALALIWGRYAVDRDDTVRQWQFVLAILEAAGELTAGMRKNPGRLKRLRGDVEGLLKLTSQPASGA